MIIAKRKENLVADMTARTHQMLAGVPESLGGKDEAMTPHEILEAALASCTIITVQMYANRKGIKLESTDAVVKIVSEGVNSEISRQLTFKGDLTAEERAKLAEIADKCPIHKLLESTIKINTTMV